MGTRHIILGLPAILLRQMFHESFPGVTYPEMCMSRNFVVVAETVTKSRSRLFFVQWRLQQKHCETSSFQGMLHHVTLCCNGVKKLRDKLQDKSLSVTAPLPCDGLVSHPGGRGGVVILLR